MKGWILPGIVGLAIVGGVFWRVTSKAQTQTDAKSSAKKSQTPLVEVVTAGPHIVEGYLHAVGSIESPYRVQLSPKNSGRIEFLQAREGDIVTKGQLLVKVDPSPAEASVAQARAAYAEAQSRYAQAKIQENPNLAAVKGQIDQQTAGLQSAEADNDQARQNSAAAITVAQSQVNDAQAKVGSAQGQVQVGRATVDREQSSLENARAKYDRSKNLYEKGYVSLQATDDARTAVDVQAKNVNIANAQLSASLQALESAKAQVASAKSGLGVARRKGISDIAASDAKRVQAKSSLNVARANSAQNPAFRENLAALRAAVDAAQAALHLAEANLADTSLRSTINGVVTNRAGDVGSLAQPGTPVLIVQYTDWLFFTCSLPVDAAPQVQVGQEVIVHVQALAGQEPRGVVTNINPAADNASRQFSVRVKLQNPQKLLRPGMFGEALLVSQKVQATVAVPHEAIKLDAAGKPQVIVIGLDRIAHPTNVVLGIANEKLTEIKSGISPGDQVVVLTYSPLKEGQIVRLPGDKAAPDGGKK